MLNTSQYPTGLGKGRDSELPPYDYGLVSASGTPIGLSHIRISPVPSHDRFAQRAKICHCTEYDVAGAHEVYKRNLLRKCFGFDVQMIIGNGARDGERSLVGHLCNYTFKGKLSTKHGWSRPRSLGGWQINCREVVVRVVHRSLG